MRRKLGRDGEARGRRDAGATLAEYSLILAFFVAISAGAIQYLTVQAGEQIDNQADCVATRPPPPECQTPAQSVPDDYETSPPTAPPYVPPSNGSATFTSVTWDGGAGSIDGVVNIDAGGTPVEGAVVYLRWTCNGANHYDTATSDANGDVTLDLGGCTGPGTATVQVYRVDSPYNVAVPIDTTVTMA